MGHDMTIQLLPNGIRPTKIWKNEVTVTFKKKTYTIGTKRAGGDLCIRKSEKLENASKKIRNQVVAQEISKILLKMGHTVDRNTANATVRAMKMLLVTQCGMKTYMAGNLLFEIMKLISTTCEQDHGESKNPSQQHLALTMRQLLKEEYKTQFKLEEKRATMCASNTPLPHPLVTPKTWGDTCRNAVHELRALPEQAWDTFSEITNSLSCRVSLPTTRRTMAPLALMAGLTIFRIADATSNPLEPTTKAPPYTPDDPLVTHEGPAYQDPEANHPPLSPIPKCTLLKGFGDDFTEQAPAARNDNKLSEKRKENNRPSKTPQISTHENETRVSNLFLELNLLRNGVIKVISDLLKSDIPITTLEENERYEQLVREELTLLINDPETAEDAYEILAAMVKKGSALANKVLGNYFHQYSKNKVSLTISNAYFFKAVLSNSLTKMSVFRIRSIEEILPTDANQTKTPESLMEEGINLMYGIGMPQNIGVAWRVFHHLVENCDIEKIKLEAHVRLAILTKTRIVDTKIINRLKKTDDPDVRLIFAIYMNAIENDPKLSDEIEKRIYDEKEKYKNQSKAHKCEFSYTFARKYEELALAQWNTDDGAMYLQRAKEHFTDSEKLGYGSKELAFLISKDTSIPLNQRVNLVINHLLNAVVTGNIEALIPLGLSLYQVGESGKAFGIFQLSEKFGNSYAKYYQYKCLNEAATQKLNLTTIEGLNPSIDEISTHHASFSSLGETLRDEAYKSGILIANSYFRTNENEDNITPILQEALKGNHHYAHFLLNPTLRKHFTEKAVSKLRSLQEKHLPIGIFTDIQMEPMSTTILDPHSQPKQLSELLKAIDENTTQTDTDEADYIKWCMAGLLGFAHVGFMCSQQQQRRLTRDKAEKKAIEAKRTEAIKAEQEKAAAREAAIRNAQKKAAQEEEAAAREAIKIAEQEKRNAAAAAIKKRNLDDTKRIFEELLDQHVECLTTRIKKERNKEKRNKDFVSEIHQLDSDLVRITHQLQRGELSSTNFCTSAAKKITDILVASGIGSWNLNFFNREDIAERRIILQKLTAVQELIQKAISKGCEIPEAVEFLDLMSKIEHPEDEEISLDPPAADTQYRKDLIEKASKAQATRKDEAKRRERRQKFLTSKVTTTSVQDPNSDTNDDLDNKGVTGLVTITPGGNYRSLTDEYERISLIEAADTIQLLCDTGPLANAINHSLEVMTASNSPKAARELINPSHELPKHDDRTIDFDTLNQDYLGNKKNKAAVRAFLNNKLDRLNQPDMAALVDLDIILLVNAARELRSIFKLRAPNEFDQLLKLRNEYRHDPNSELTETELYRYYQENKVVLTMFFENSILSNISAS